MFQSCDIEETSKSFSTSSMHKAQLNVGISCQIKLEEREMESDHSFPMLYCSAKPSRSGGELIWKKEMIAIIHCHLRTKDPE